MKQIKKDLIRKKEQRKRVAKKAQEKKTIFENNDAKPRSKVKADP
jgi:hypothetical protein